MSETDLSRVIRETLRAKGYRVERINSGSVFLSYTPKKGGKPRGRRIVLASPGTPDLLVLMPYCWLETKTPVGEANENQLLWHAWAKMNGVRAIFTRSIGEAARFVDACAREDRHGKRCPVAECPMEDQHGEQS